MLEIFTQFIERAHQWPTRVADGILHYEGNGQQNDFQGLATGLFRSLLKLFDLRFETAEIPDDSRIPSVGKSCDSIECVLTEACQVERRAGLLNRLRPDLRFGDVIKLAFEFNRIMSPDRQQRFKKFVGARAAPF